MEEQRVGGSWKVKLVQHQPADASVDRILQQHRVGALRHAWWKEEEQQEEDKGEQLENFIPTGVCRKPDPSLAGPLVMNLKENWMYRVLVQSRSRDTSIRMPSCTENTRQDLFFFLLPNKELAGVTHVAAWD